MSNIHFIGIGGIGVSALARYYLTNGHNVSGSDARESEITENLSAEGATVYIGSSESYIDNSTSRVIRSAAIPEGNPELKRAESLGIPVSTYAEALAELIEKHFTIAVSGSHGKGTTTALLALMLTEAGIDPTVIIGTRLREFGGTNFRQGKSKYLLIEADEYARSFHNYRPDIAVITNIDAEHLDVFGDIDGVVEAFRQYTGNLPENATLILNKQDPHSERIKEGCKAKVIYFERGESWPLRVPGEFNQLNAEAAWQAARLLGVERSVAEKAVSSYEGAWRRMEELEPKNGYERAIFFSDYGHHPTEVRATVRAFKERYPERGLLLVYQPHQARRLDSLFNEFTTAFEEADELVLLPVYEVAGREAGIERTSEDLADAVRSYNEDTGKSQRVHNLQSVDDALTLIDEQLVVFMGAGDIDGDVRKHFRSKLLPR